MSFRISAEGVQGESRQLWLVVPNAWQATQGKDGTVAARREVVALLTDFDVERDGAHQRFVHRDGRPFTAEETELIGSTTDDDMRAAARQLAGAPERLAELIAPYVHAARREDTGPPPAG
jgi:hypothetical protein